MGRSFTEKISRQRNVMTLSLTREAQSVMDRVILVTGAMRTGSTMLGRLLRSMNRVEAFHEPGVVYALFPQINCMDTEVWKLLFSASIFEDCLVRSINATSLNMNETDESCVHLSLDESEISRRVTCTLDHEALLEKSLGFTACVKVPEMLPYLERYRSLFPHSPVIVTLRRPERVISSLIRKEYYADKRLFQRPKKWPNRVVEGKYYPFWLPEERYSEWEMLTEFSRCCLSFSFQYDNYAFRDTDVVVDYDVFCSDPVGYWETISSKFGWEAGPVTEQLLLGVSEPPLTAVSPLNSQDLEYLTLAIDSYQRVNSLQ